MGTGRVRFWSWIASILMFGLVASMLGAPVASAAPGDPFVNKTLPAITGTAKVGEKLTAKPGTWEPVPTAVTYQWLRNGAPVAGSTATTYVLTAADLGQLVSVRETVTGGDLASTFKDSAATAKVVAGTLKSAVPTITGTATVGSTLTAAAAGWTDKVKLSYQWYANGKTIAKATGAKLKLGKSQAGKRVTVKVTGTLAGYAPASRVSSATAKVLKVLKAGSPKISGKAKVGSKLKVKAGSWTSKTKKSYRWLRDGAPIGKATKSKYKLTASDGGKKISVTVTGKRSGYTTVSRTSKAVSVKLMSLKQGTPKVSGTARVGSTLTVNPGSWTKGTTVKYQWYADGAKVARGTGKSLRPGWLEAGRKLKVTVTGSKTGYGTASKTVTLPKAIPTDAVYRVGTDIPAGDLIGAGASYTRCGWLRLSRLDGNITNETEIGEEGLLGFRTISTGQALATVHAGDPYFVSSGCGRWSKLSTTPSLKTSVGAGDYAVGIHVEPGIWRTTNATMACYVELALGFEGTDVEIPDGGVYDGGSTAVEFPLESSLARFSSEGCGTWTRIGDIPLDESRSSRVAPSGKSWRAPTERRSVGDKVDLAGLR